MLGRGSLIAAVALPLIVLAGACGGGGASEEAPRNGAGAPGNAPENAIVRPAGGGKEAEANRPANEAMPEDSADPGLAAMTPYQRRAYDRGLRDCSAGRYEPDPHPESYRIGCAAAHDR